MGQTTFSGPIKAGTIDSTTGTTVGTDVKNIGSVVMAQSASISETGDGASTGIVIPAKSQVVGVFVYPTVLFEGDVTLGSTVNGTDLSAALTAPVDNSRSVFAPATSEVWHDIGDTDVEVFHDSTNAGAGNGRAVITVEYIQNNNLL